MKNIKPELINKCLENYLEFLKHPKNNWQSPQDPTTFLNSDASVKDWLEIEVKHIKDETKAATPEYHKCPVCENEQLITLPSCMNCYFEKRFWKNEEEIKEYKNFFKTLT